MEKIHLRPHHFVCIINFRGLGYDDIFVRDVRLILDAMEKNQDKKFIYVKNGCDDICKHCPKRRGETCEDEALVTELDSAFFKILDLSWSDVFCLTKIKEMVRTKLSIQQFENVCCKCQWFQMCKSECSSCKMAGKEA